ncbi:hypothetical protein Tco_0411120 [Tanacetum coccineum]
MSTLTQDVLATGYENRPHMLEIGSYDTWQSRMLMYLERKENGQMLLNSTLNEKKQMECDIRVANIVLQGLANDIYTLLSHRKIDNSNWYRVKELINHDPLALVAYMYNAPSSYTNQASLYNHQVSYAPQQLYEAPIVQQQSLKITISPDSELAIPTFNSTDDPIESLNKAMMFLSKAFTIRYPQINNQLRTSSNLRTQANVQMEEL